MGSLPDFANVPVKVKVGKKEYSLSKPTLSDWAKYHRFIEELYFKDLQQRLEYLPESAQETRKVIIDKIASRQFEKDVGGIADSFEASVFLTKIMLQKHHPDISDEEICLLLEDEIFAKTQNKLLGLPEEDEKKEEAEEKKAEKT